MLPTIPKLPRGTREAVAPLARAAFIFRGVFVEAADGRPIEDILDERHDAVALANRVLDHWLMHLGIDPETGDDVSTG